MFETHRSKEHRNSSEKESMTKDKSLEKAEKQVELLKEEIESLKTKLQKKESEFSRKEEEMLKKEKKLTEMAEQNAEKIESLETEVQKKNEELSNKEKEILKKEKEITETMKQNEDNTESLKKEIEEKESKIQRYSQRLSQMKENLNVAHTKMDGYKSRLAYLSERRVKQDQRLVEDTLASNRQSELERDFKAFFDEDRLDACEKMQSIYLNREENYIYIYYPRLACIILETAYEQAKEVNEATVDLFKELTKNMINGAAEMGTNYCITRKFHMEGKYSYDCCTVPVTIPLWAKESEYLKDVVDGMTLALKETAHICNLDSLVNDVSNATFMKWTEWCEEEKSCMFTPAWHLIEGLHKYIKACIRLTWRMVTQVPPLKLEYFSSKFDKDIHKNVGYVNNFSMRRRTQLSAKQVQTGEIKCYLWPGLQDGGGRRIRPGEVLCGFKE